VGFRPQRQGHADGADGLDALAGLGHSSQCFHSSKVKATGRGVRAPPAHFVAPGTVPGTLPLSVLLPLFPTGRPYFTLGRGSSWDSPQGNIPRLFGPAQVVKERVRSVHTQI
jgi:hypothetical protein